MRKIFIEIDRSADLTKNEINRLLRKAMKQDNVFVSVKSLKYIDIANKSKKPIELGEGSGLLISKIYVSEDGFTPEEYKEITDSFDGFIGDKNVIERDSGKDNEEARRMYEVIEMKGPLPYPDKQFILIRAVIGDIKERLFIRYKN